MELTKYDLDDIFTNTELNGLIRDYIAESDEKLPSFLRHNSMISELCKEHFDRLRDEILDKLDSIGFNLYDWDEKYIDFSDFLKILLDCYENEMNYIG